MDYTLYWPIPIIALFFPASLFIRALQSTFVAHAAGSVIWVYVTPLTTEQWVSLIPVVAIERLIATLLAVCRIKLLLTVTSWKREEAMQKALGKRLLANLAMTAANC